MILCIKELLISKVSYTPLILGADLGAGGYRYGEFTLLRDNMVAVWATIKIGFRPQISQSLSIGLPFTATFGEVPCWFTGVGLFDYRRRNHPHWATGATNTQLPHIVSNITIHGEPIDNETPFSWKMNDEIKLFTIYRKINDS